MNIFLSPENPHSGNHPAPHIPSDLSIWLPPCRRPGVGRQELIRTVWFASGDRERDRQRHRATQATPTGHAPPSWSAAFAAAAASSPRSPSILAQGLRRSQDAAAVGPRKVSIEDTARGPGASLRAPAPVDSRSLRAFPT
eukprot:TRINITY_DN5224_c0_g1_i1.p2 TRINITY_DN5224_c0_g1~~TRINITY_DN5224_c0_g1_i1.p2  ORF type:complete len:140 (+),score=26.31 TRINITY_DN5224_c0_g1_i1:110-529(+)